MADGRITDKKVLESAGIIAEYCKQQRGCQNCLFRAYGADHWKCLIEAYDIRYALENKSAKQKNHGYI